MKRMARAAAQFGFGVSVVTAWSAAATRPAAAAPAPTESETRVVARLDDTGRTLLYRSCHGAEGDPSCALGSGASGANGVQTVTLDAAAGAVDAAHAVFTPIRAGTRTALHVKVPLLDVSPDQRAWEAVLVPGPSPVVAAGLTGWTKGEPGERTGVRVVELPAEGGKGTTELVVGEIHEDRRICGQSETLIRPRGLDPTTLTLRGVTLPRLSAEARAAATPITAEPIDPNTLAAPLAPLLRATATSADGSAAALADGSTATAWYEQRSGDGHGEFVTMTGAPELPFTRLVFTLTPTPSPATANPLTTALADPTAPLSVHLATGAHLYEVTFPRRDRERDHGANAANAANTFVVDLPEPAATGCLSVVLDRAQHEASRPHPVVAIAEVTAYGPFDGPGGSAEAVARALDDEARGDAAVQELARMGDAGLRAAGARLPALHVSGQRRALSVAESGSCEVAAPLFVTELARTGVAPDLAARSERALRRCDRRAAAPLVKALAAPGAPVDIARVAAEVAPDDALPLLVHHLAVTAPDAPGERGFRDALAHAAERASVDTIRKVLREPGEPGEPADSASPAATLSLVRALGKRASAIAAEATPIALQAARDPAPSRRYLAVDPLVALAGARAPQVLAALGTLTTDSAWTVRLRLAERADEVPELVSWAPRAVDDPSPRVREAALGALARKKLAPPSVAAHAGDAEIWTFVRLAAIAALQTDPARGESDDTLAHAITDDPSLEVRAAALDALAARGSPAADKLVRQLLDREDLSAEVRAGAARAAGALCLRDQADHLNELARPLLNVDASESARLVAVQALAALGRLHPKDLGRRVAPFAADGVPAESRAAARQALAPTSPRCSP